MQKRHTVEIIDSRQALVTDNVTKGTLIFTYSGPQDTEDNPLIDAINEFQQNLWDNQSLQLSLFNENKITFSNIFVMEGSVVMNGCDIDNPFLHNVDLIKVNIKNCDGVNLWFAEMKDYNLDQKLTEIIIKFVSREHQLKNSFSEHVNDVLIFGTDVKTK